MSSTRSVARSATRPTIAVVLVGVVVCLVAWQRSGTSSERVVPAGTTVFDLDVPAVSRLAPDLLDALRRATTDADRDGVVLDIKSGWRSSAEQADLLADAVTRYGSAEIAARWVAPPSRSAHVSGDAVDVGGHGASAWLSEHGVAYGLCRIYDNEPWHFELRSAAVSDGCPRRYPDASHDPRMR